MTLRLFVPLIVIVLLSIAFVTQPLQADQQITVLVIDDKYFPIEQFIAAGPDICVDNHYHAADFNSATSLDGTILYDEEGCGYGPIDSIPVKEVTVKDDSAVGMVNGEGISVSSQEKHSLSADMTLKECEAIFCGPYSSEGDSLNTVDSDDEFLYPVPIVNLGPNDAVNSQLVVILSSEVTLGQIYYKDEYGGVLDFGGTFTGCTDTGIIVCSLGTISPTEDPEDLDPYYLIFTVTANHFAEDIIPFFSATVTSKTADPDSENNRLVYHTPTIKYHEHVNVSFVNDVAPSYQVDIFPNEEFALSHSYTWSDDPNSRFNLVSFSHDDYDFVPISRHAKGNFTLDLPTNSSHSILFLAVTQYPITVEGGNEFSFLPQSPTNDNLFDAESKVVITATPPNYGLILYELEGWEGPVIQAYGNSAQIFVDGPTIIEAKWRQNYLPLFLFIIMSIAVISAFFVMKMTHKIPQKETKLEIETGKKHLDKGYYDELRQFLKQKELEKLDSMLDSKLITDARHSIIKQKLEEID